MTKRRLSITKDCHDNITPRNTRSKTSETVTEHSLPIPFDLVLEIFSRLPVKSIAICRCVSKLWASILRCPDFTDLFLTKSSSRQPQILFACPQGDKVIIFSSQLPRNPDEKSSLLVADHLMHLPLNVFGTMVSRIGSFFCFVEGRGGKGRVKNTQVICNPSTRRSLNLPKVKTRRNQVHSDLGYDPVDKQFKVLSMTWSCGPRYWEEHQVLTLGTEKQSWRIIECCIPHAFSKYDGSYPEASSSDRICINGVLYYRAFHMTLGTSIVVCFDFRYEKFSFFEVVDIGFSNKARLINYNGKLGFLRSDSDVPGYIGGRTTRIELIVIGDWKNQVWSKHTYILPASWKTIVGGATLRFVGVTKTNEIVLTLCFLQTRFYLFYYNMERNILTRVEVKGMNRCYKIHTFLDHVEDVNLIWD